MGFGTTYEFDTIFKSIGLVFSNDSPVKSDTFDTISVGNLNLNDNRRIHRQRQTKFFRL